jgi:hypothetical protein
MLNVKQCGHYYNDSEYKQNANAGSFMLFISAKILIALIRSRVEMLRNIKLRSYNDTVSRMVRLMGAGKWEGR